MSDTRRFEDGGIDHMNESKQEVHIAFNNSGFQQVYLISSAINQTNNSLSTYVCLFFFHIPNGYLFEHSVKIAIAVGAAACHGLNVIILRFVC